MCRNTRCERNHEANLTQDHAELALLLASFDNNEAIEEVFLNEEKVTPRLKLASGETTQSNVWYLDNGVSNHMTGQKDKFYDLNQTTQGYVKFGDGSKVRIEGKGSIIF